MRPRLHIVHNGKFLQNPTLIESDAVRRRFVLTKSNRMNAEADLVYTQTYGSGDVLHVLAACGKPYVVHMGGDIWNEISEDPRRLTFINRVLKNAVLIVANSAFLYRIVKAHGFLNSMFLPGGLWGFDESIHGVMPRRFRPKEHHPERPRRFLMSISLKVWKKYRGIDMLMQRVGDYFQSNRFELACAGSTNDREFKYQLQERGVEFVGNRQDWQKYLPQADVFLHPSMFDCFPRALAEAKCAGLPAIAFRVAGNVEVGEAPVYVDPSSSDEVLGALEALEDRGLREYLGWLGRENAMRKTEAHREDYSAIFEELLKDGPEKLIRNCEEVIR